jgi:hypothetical protein
MFFACGGVSKALSAKGSSMSWTAAKKNVVRIFDIFIQQDEELLAAAGIVTWEQLDEATLCAPAVYERFTYFLLYTFKIEQGNANQGDPQDGSTVRNRIGTAINLACDKFKATGSSDTKRFVDCLDTNSTSEHAKWLRGLKANIMRETFERDKAAGKQMDNSESKPPPPRPHHSAA